MGHSTHGRTLAASGSLEERFRRWRKLDHRVYRQWIHPPLLSDWLCIHHYEGSWSDPNAPYWGGLQMDYTFQQVYGPWLLKHEGTADHWTPMEQIWTALKAYKTRGFEPWPNTSRLCGL
ncbi:MAG TPA: hypothetical protein VFK97_00705 [Candidatus Saccharimonadales bacterium]|nr:hypothetical protein [Candidatus Saccharimonadales bacterium]